MKKYDIAHREEHRERDRRRHHSTKTERNAESREYRASNLARLREYDRARYVSHREKRLAAVKASAAKFPERAAARKAAYKARKRRATVPLSQAQQDRINQMYALAQALTVLCGEPYHVDHKTPIARGGLHHPDNLQVLRGVDNLKKGARVAA